MHFNMTLEKALQISEQNQGTVCATLPRVSVLGTGLPRQISPGVRLLESWCSCLYSLLPALPEVLGDARKLSAFWVFDDYLVCHWDSCLL